MGRSTLLALALVFTGCVDAWADWDECSVTEPRQASLDAAGATRLEIDAGAGNLDVIGAPGTDRVEIQGTACAVDREQLAGIELRTERRGDTLFVETVFREDMDGNRRLSLELEVPPMLEVVIDDGSGLTSVRGVASLSIEDGSGTLEIRDVAGDVEVEDGSGTMTLTGIGGNVRIGDGSGGIEVADITGDVRIDDDGSGPIDLRGVGGSVTIGEDGSGGIDAREIRGDFTLHRDGSGSVHVDAAGKVTLPAE